MTLDEIANGHRTRLGMDVAIRQYDDYAVLTLISPTGQAVSCISYKRKDGDWQYVGIANAIEI